MSKSYEYWTDKSFLRIKLQQQRQKTSNLFVDATCEYVIPIAIHIFANHAGVQYKQMKCSITNLMK